MRFRGIISVICLIVVGLGILANGCSSEKDCQEKAYREGRDYEWTGYIGSIGSCSAK